MKFYLILLLLIIGLFLFPVKTFACDLSYDVFYQSSSACFSSCGSGGDNGGWMQTTECFADGNRTYKWFTGTDCSCGGGGGGGFPPPPDCGGGVCTERVAGIVYKNGIRVNTNYSIVTNFPGRYAVWHDNALEYWMIGESYFEVFPFGSGSGPIIGLTDPDPGYTCTWSFNNWPLAPWSPWSSVGDLGANNDSNPIGLFSGTGCFAYIPYIRHRVSADGGFSDSGSGWQNLLWFNLVPIPPGQLSGRVTNTTSGTGIANIYINTTGNNSSTGFNCGGALPWQTSMKTDANGYYSATSVPVGTNFCLRAPAVTGYTFTSGGYECQWAGQARGTVACGAGTTLDQPTDNAYNFTYTPCPAAGTIPACRTADGSVANGNCSTIPYSANCGTFCSPSLICAVTPPAPTISIQPDCINPNHTGTDYTISWTNPAVPVDWVAISTDSSHNSYYQKYVLGASSTTAPNGFNGVGGFSGALVLQPGTTYYVWVSNGLLSSPATFTTPSCVPNCTISRTPNSKVVLGTSVTFTNFFSLDPSLTTYDLRGGFYAEKIAANGNLVRKWTSSPAKNAISGHSGTLSSAISTWTPQEIGSYDVACKAWNDSKAEYIGKTYLSTNPYSDPACPGSNCVDLPPGDLFPPGSSYNGGSDSTSHFTVEVCDATTCPAWLKTTGGDVHSNQ